MVNVLRLYHLHLVSLLRVQPPTSPEDVEAIGSLRSQTDHALSQNDLRALLAPTCCFDINREDCGRDNYKRRCRIRSLLLTVGGSFD